MKNKQPNLSLARLLTLFGIRADRMGFKIPKDELKDVDIKSEMELIRQKKSKLSYRLRCVVEYRYTKLVEE